jgi:thioredoxin 2
MLGLVQTQAAELEMMTCSACGATHRVPAHKLKQGAEPRCGRCKSPLGDGKTMVVTDGSFATRVDACEQPVLVDAWAPWCGPCRQLAPVIDELASELSGRVRVVKLNVDENPQTAQRFEVRSIPTLIVMRGGREVGRILGARPKSEILRQLDQVLASS